MTGFFPHGVYSRHAYEDSRCCTSRVIKGREILHNQSDKIGQTDKLEHKALTQCPNNYRALPLGADKERNWMIRGHFHEDNASRA